MEDPQVRRAAYVVGLDEQAAPESAAGTNTADLYDPQDAYTANSLPAVWHRHSPTSFSGRLNRRPSRPFQ